MISEFCREYQKRDLWYIYKNRLKERWPDLEDAELDQHRGRYDRLTQAIQIRCGESYTSVQDFIDRLWFEIYLRLR